MAVSPWSPRQRRWLQALGYSVLRPREAGGVELAATPFAVAEPVAASAYVAQAPLARAPAQDPAPGPAGRAPAPPPAVAAAPAGGDPGPVRASLRRPARLPDRLQLAMLRASGLDPSDPAAQAAMAEWPVAQLRGDAAAKRAFWPTLRALRRRPQ